MAKVQLRRFDWAGFVKAGTFEHLVLGVASTGFTLVLLDANAKLSSWVLVDAGVSVWCVLLGYLRVWKTAREEQETADFWAAIDRRSGAYDTIVNRVFEFPYVFLISLLPLMSPLPQLFMTVLFLFYVVDNHYNAILARGAAQVAAAEDSSGGANESPVASGSDAGQGSLGTYLRSLALAVRRAIWMTADESRRIDQGDGHGPYFRTRYRYNQWLMVVLLVALAWTLLDRNMLVALPVGAGAAAIAALLTITFIELVVEPFRNFGLHFER